MVVRLKEHILIMLKIIFIVAIAESDASIDVPLKTINIDLDSDRPDSGMSVIPQNNFTYY